MRITFLLTQSLESPGGGGRYLPLAKSLIHLGHSVTIVALHHDYDRLDQRRFVFDEVEVRYVGQMHVRKVGSHKMYYGSLKLVWVVLLATLQLTWAALTIPCDVIHVCKTQPMNGIAAWFAYFLRRKPIYLDSDDYEAVNNRFSARGQQKIVAWFEDWMPSFASGMTVNTTFIYRRFEALGFPTDRMRLVPNGVDGERFALLERSDVEQAIERLKQSLEIRKHDQVVVYIGTISLISHAIDLLLEAFAQVLHSEPNALLLVVGGGEDLDILVAMADQLQISSRVKFLGRVRSDQVPLYYRLGQISVDPMRDTLPARSSLSLKILESIVAGVPCVTSDIGDRRQMLGNAGLAVTPDDAEALAAAILSLLSDVQQQTQMRDVARQMRSRCLWSSRVQTFASVYDQRDPSI